MKAQVPDPLALTLDHVVPLALGGWHDLINLRPAHFVCNSRKSATFSGQLMLVYTPRTGGIECLG